MSVPHRRITLNDLTRGYIPQRPSSSGGMVPPPLPPRRRSNLGPAGTLFGSPFGGGYTSPYGGDMYGSAYNPLYPYRSSYPSRYGGYGGYGGYGAEDPYSPFQGVESIVRAISSLSMMVESTYQSMFMSFRAVLGVAENMDQLRRVVFDLFGSLTLVKTVIWFCKKVLYILGLLKNNPVREKVWEAAAAEVVGGAGPAAASTGRTWPLVAFFGLMLGGPYVLYKLATPSANPSSWDPKTEGGIKCVAIHDFETDQKGELPFRRGEVLLRHKQVQGGWALASKKAGQIGYVPADRLKAVNQVAAGAQQKPVAMGNGPVNYHSHGLPSAYAHLNPTAVPNFGGANLGFSDTEMALLARFGYQPTGTTHWPAGPSQQYPTGTAAALPTFPSFVPPPAAESVAAPPPAESVAGSPPVESPGAPPLVESPAAPPLVESAAAPPPAAPAQSSVAQTPDKQD